MKRLFSETRARQLGVFWGAVIIAGIFVSDYVRVLPSIGIAGLFVTGVGYALAHRRIAQRAHWPALLSFVLVYALHVGTALLHAGWSNEILQRDAVLQLPFLLLPVAFLLLPSWLVVHKRALWLVLIGGCLGAAARATSYYLLHQKIIDQDYLHSKVMPTVPDHIRFSLLVSMAVLAGLVLVLNKELHPRLRVATLVGVVLLFLFQHLLAVRSGIVTMYAAGALWLVWLGWQLRHWRVALAGAGLVLLLGGACLLLFPTLQNKIIATRSDAEQLDSSSAANYYSVTARVYSYDVAWALVKQRPWLGLSKVELEAAMARQYHAMYPGIEPAHYLLPHNQFLYNLAAYGAVGLLVFVVGFYYALWVGIRQRNIMLLLMYSIVSLSFVVEYTLETQIGVLIGLFFILLAAAPTAPAGAPQAPTLR
ncbi:MAG: O-antigen ligase family protein [Janthinobacterium lividum]